MNKKSPGTVMRKEKKNIIQNNGNEHLNINYDSGYRLYIFTMPHTISAIVMLDIYFTSLLGAFCSDIFI